MGLYPTYTIWELTKIGDPEIVPSKYGTPNFRKLRYKGAWCFDFLQLAQFQLLCVPVVGRGLV